MGMFVGTPRGAFVLGLLSGLPSYIYIYIYI